MVPALQSPAPPGAPPEDVAPAPGLFARAFAGACRRWVLAALAGAVLGAGAALAYYLNAPQKFTATAALQVSPRTNLFGDAENPKAESDYRRQQAALVRNRDVLLKALESKKVADSALLSGQVDPVAFLEVELKTAVSESGLIRVSLTGERPDELATVLNAVVAAYLSVVVDAEATQREIALGETDRLITLSDGRIRKLHDSLRQLTNTLRTSDTKSLSVQQQASIQEYTNLYNEQLRLDAEQRATLSQLGVDREDLKVVKTRPVAPTTLEAALAADPTVQLALSEVTLLKEALSRAADTVRPGSPAHERLVTDLKAAEDKAVSVKKARSPSVEARLRDESVRAIENRIVQSESRLRVMAHQHEALKGAVERAREAVEKIGLGSRDVEDLQAQINSETTILNKLRNDRAQLQLQIEQQTDPQTKKPKRRVKSGPAVDAASARPAASGVAATAGLGVLGFAGGALCVGYLDARRRRLVHTTEVVHTMRVRALGALPEIPELPGVHLPDVWEAPLGTPGVQLVEAVNDARTMLLAGAPDRNPQVIAVTSSTQGEGKTTLACLLALSLARIAKRTLLIDADLRKPQVAARLGLMPTVGFGEVLRDEVRPLSAIGGVPGTSLAVLTAGRPCQTVIHALSREHVTRLLGELRRQFDYIVIDTCPTALTDSLVVGSCADAAVLVVRSGVSTETEVREACERLLAARVPLAGGVVNGIAPDSRPLRYPYVTASQSLPAAPVGG